jgi:uncharacterized membrane protein
MNHPSEKAPRQRLTWVDGARGIAVLWMIEAHVCNAFLAQDLKRTPVFAHLTYLNGLVAPTFLTVSGYLLGCAILRRQGRVPARFWWRLLGIAGCGYALHFPFVEIGNRDWQGALRSGTLVDVLQCLALSQGLFVLGSRLPRAKTCVLALTAFFVGAAPTVYRIQGLPAFIQGYLNPSSGALFPLFPWAGFVGLGVWAGVSNRKHLWWIGAIAGLMLGLLLPEPDPFTGASLPFFFERLGWVCLGLAVLQHSGGEWLPGFVSLAGRRSLEMYVGHLVVLGGIWGLREWSGAGGAGVWEAAGLWTGLVTGLLLLCRRLESRSRIKES